MLFGKLKELEGGSLTNSRGKGVLGQGLSGKGMFPKYRKVATFKGGH